MESDRRDCSHSAYHDVGRHNQEAPRKRQERSMVVAEKLKIMEDIRNDGCEIAKFGIHIGKAFAEVRSRDMQYFDWIVGQDMWRQAGEEFKRYPESQSIATKKAKTEDIA